MVFGSLSNLENYKNLHPRFEKAIAFLHSPALYSLTVGKHQIDGENIYASVNEYATKPEGYLEAHRIYIDIQIVTKGTEKIGFAPLQNQPVKEEYSREKDISFYTADCDYLTLTPGKFAIFFPHDLHKPGITAHDPEEVKKVVIKIRA
jgi:biofilm protein TabA